jgi:hypothetical protein
MPVYKYKQLLVSASFQLSSASPSNHACVSLTPLPIIITPSLPPHSLPLLILSSFIPRLIRIPRLRNPMLLSTIIRRPSRRCIALIIPSAILLLIIIPAILRVHRRRLVPHRCRRLICELAMATAALGTASAIFVSPSIISTDIGGGTGRGKGIYKIKNRKTRPMKIKIPANTHLPQRYQAE